MRIMITIKCICYMWEYLCSDNKCLQFVLKNFVYRFKDDGPISRVFTSSQKSTHMLKI